MEAQQSEAKWRRRAKLLQETNERLEAMLQKRPGNANVSGRFSVNGVNKAHARWCKEERKYLVHYGLAILCERFVKARTLATRAIKGNTSINRPMSKR